MTDDTSPLWFRTGHDHVWPPYAPLAATSLPLPAVRTEGCRITLADGRQLIDGIASWWTACHGYNHPHIRAAIADQLARMPHVMFGGLVHEPAYRLAARLARLLPGALNRMFFAESGSVSVEVAMKMAMQFWLNQGARGRTKFVSFRGGYHGDTLATMSVCDPEEGMHSLFAGALLDQYVVDLPADEPARDALDRLLKASRDAIAAVIVEPLVQGAGGFRMHDEETLRFLRDVTRAHDTLLIFDEIMTGFGRTGHMFACEAAGVVPDILTLSKALTGGTLPLSVAAASDDVAAAFMNADPGQALMHGPTFMANALACAAANASLDLFEREPRLDQVAAIERHFRRELEAARSFKGVRDVRVRGAIGVIEVVQLNDLDALKRAFVDRGVFIRPFGNVIYLTPALTITQDDLDTLTGTMLDVVEAWSTRVF